MWALIVLIVLSIFEIGFVLGKHGEPGPNYNFWTKLTDEAIVWWLLYEAGLFDKYL